MAAVEPLTSGSSWLMSPGVCVLILTLFGTPELWSVRSRVEQADLRPTAGVWACDWTSSWLLTTTINRCVLTLFRKTQVHLQIRCRTSDMSDFSQLHVSNFECQKFSVSVSSLWNRKGVISLIGLKIKYYFSDNMGNKATQSQRLDRTCTIKESLAEIFKPWLHFTKLIWNMHVTKISHSLTQMFWTNTGELSKGDKMSKEIRWSDKWKMPQRDDTDN